MKTNILDLDAIPQNDSLTFKEYIQRRKVNSNDPKVQKFNRELNEITTKLESALKDIYDTPVQTILAAKKLSRPENILKVTLIKGIDLERRIDGSHGSYKTLRKIARLFKDSPRVHKYKIASRICPTIIGRNNKRRKLNKNDYLNEKNKYNNNIKNVFKSLKKAAKPHGYTFTSSGLYMQLIRLETNRSD